jgi:RNA polymerase sigma-70 factor, ECF subfamily
MDPSTGMSDPVPPIHRDPSELLRRWQEAGDRGALDELLRSEIRTLKQVVLARGRSMTTASASASDIAQEAVLRLLRLEDPPRFEDPRELSRYLWVTAWRLLLQRVRRPYRRKNSFDQVQTSQLPALSAEESAALEAREAASALDLAMNLLPDADRDVLHQVYFEGLKLADLARSSGVSESALKMRVARARQRLSALMAGWEDMIG